MSSSLFSSGVGAFISSIYLFPSSFLFFSKMDKFVGGTLFNGDRTKFKSWQTTVVGFLRFHDAYRYVSPDGEEVPPLEEPGPHAWDLFSQQRRQDRKEAAAKSRKAFGIIMANLDPTLVPIVEAVEIDENPRRAWQKLEQMFGRTALSHSDLIVLRNEVTSFALQPPMSFSAWFPAFEAKAERAAMNLQEKMITLQSSGYLPSHLSEVLYACMVQSVPWESMIERFRAADTLRGPESRQPKRKPVIALLGHREESDEEDGDEDEDRGPPRGFSNKKPAMLCWNCQNRGHNAMECNTPYCNKCKTNHLYRNCPFLSGTAAQKNAKGANSKQQQGKQQQGSQQQGRQQQQQQDKKKAGAFKAGKVAQSAAGGKPSFQNKKKGVRSLSISAYSDDDDDDDDEDVDMPGTFDDYPIDRTHINVLRLSKATTDNRCKLDSGADVSVFMDKSSLHNVTKLNKPLTMYTASDQPVRARHMGRFNEHVGDVVVCPEVGENLLSTLDLQRRGYTVVMLPLSSGEDTGAVILDPQGQVVMTADDELVVDLDKTPTERESASLSRIPSVRRIKGNVSVTTNLSALCMFVHQLGGHWSKETMLRVARHQAIQGFPLEEEDIRKHWKECASCYKGKMARAPLHPRTTGSSSSPQVEPPSGGEPKPNFYMLSSDTYGPVTLGGPKTGIRSKAYTVNFIATPSSFMSTRVMSSKLEVLKWTKEVVQEYTMHGHHSRVAGQPIAVFQSDSDAVYKAQEFQDYLASEGIKAQWSAPYVHEQNGVAERANRTIGEVVATLFAAAPWMPKSAWSRAVEYAVLCLNLHVRKGATKTPYELFYGKKPQFTDLKMYPWGAPLEFSIPLEKRDWLGAAHSATGAYIGPVLQSKGAIWVLHLATGRIVSTFTYQLYSAVPPEFVTQFDVTPLLVAGQVSLAGGEEVLAEDELPQAQDEEGPLITAANISRQEPKTGEPQSIPQPNVGSVPLQAALATGLSPQGQGREGILSSPLPLGRSTEVDSSVSNVLPPTAQSGGGIQELSPPVSSTPINPTSSYNLRPRNNDLGMVYVHRLTAVMAKVRKIAQRSPDNPTVKEALSSSAAEKWRLAMSKELEQLKDLGVYSLVDTFPTWARPIRTHMVLKASRDEAGLIYKYKARLVAQGDRQHPSTYDLIQSPTARLAAVRLVIAIAAHKGRDVKAYDVPGAYLHSPTDKAKSTQGDPNLFIVLPDGTKARLERFLYGLKQSGLEWHETVKTLLRRLGYIQSMAEPCLFVWRSNHDARVGTEFGARERFHIIVVYVDDFLGFGSDDEIEELFYQSMCKRFGELKKKEGNFTFLSIFIEQFPDGTKKLSMPGYITTMLEKLGMRSCKAAVNPDYSKPQPQSEIMGDQKEYMTILGSLMYLACSVRFDLLCVLSRLATKARAPTQTDSGAIKRVVRYVAGTKDLGIVFRPVSRVELACKVDAAFDSEPQSKSRSGMCYSLGDNEASFHARSVKQGLLANSSTEAEYVALYEATLEIVWMRYLLADMGFPQRGATVVHEDNESCIKIAQGSGSERTKHFTRRLHYVREAVGDGLIQIHHLNSEAMTADLLTKALPDDVFVQHRNTLLGGPLR